MTIKTGQTDVQAYTKPLLAKIAAGEIDPSFVKKFRDKQDGVVKVVLRP